MQKTDNLTNSKEWESEHRVRKRKQFFDETQESPNHQQLDAKEVFRTGTYLVIIDRLIAELQKRATSYEKFFKRFGFILNILSIDDEQIRTCCKELTEIYREDLEETFAEECVQFKNFLANTPSAALVEPVISISESGTNKKENEQSEKMKISYSSLLCIIREANLGSVFPNMDIILRIILSIAVTNCSGERSFSTMKRVKNYLRNSMAEERLNSLTIMAIETEMTQQLTFEEVFQTFCSAKKRRKISQ